MSTNLGSNISGLLARVESATGPDRQLFIDVALAVLPDYPTLVDWRSGFNTFIGCGAWTDASLALCERVLPEIEGWKLEPSFARIYVPDHAYSGNGKTPALALLAAMLKALIASAASPEGDAS